MSNDCWTTIILAENGTKILSIFAYLFLNSFVHFVLNKFIYLSHLKKFSQIKMTNSHQGVQKSLF